MAVLKFQDARETVVDRVRSGAAGLARESLPLIQSPGCVLAEPVYADRDFPPFRRSTRDGYAVRSADLARLPARLRLRGQIRAGSEFTGTVGEMECVEIMTGAAVPEGADAVVMVEHTCLQDGVVEPRRSIGGLGPAAGPVAVAGALPVRMWWRRQARPVTATFCCRRAAAWAMRKLPWRPPWASRP